MSDGLSREEAREKIFAKVAPAVFEKVLEELKAGKALVGSERLALPTHKPTVAGADDRLRAAIIDAFRTAGLKPPDAAALAGSREGAGGGHRQGRRAAAAREGAHAPRHHRVSHRGVCSS